MSGHGWSGIDRRAFAVVPPGLESLLLAELRELGVGGTEQVGGVEFAADPAKLAMVLVRARVPGRVWVRVGRGPASTLEGLAAGLRTLPWPRFGRPRQPVEVEVVGQGTKLRRRDFVSSKASLAIGDALRVPGRWSGPRPRGPLQVLLRLDGDRAEVSVDAGGGLLHARGWRPQTAKAPLRETLAAALLRAGGWSPGTPLVDPFCGSGTLPLEAARWAAGWSPRSGWTYAASSWPEVGPAIAATEARRGPSTPTVIVASDRDAGAVAAARGNARRAGVDGRVRVEHAPFEALDPPAPEGLLVANLPFGQRVGRADALGGLYAGWGAHHRAAWPGWRAVLLAADPALLTRWDRTVDVRFRFKHGGIPVVVGVIDR